MNTSDIKKLMDDLVIVANEVNGNSAQLSFQIGGENIFIDCLRNPKKRSTLWKIHYKGDTHTNLSKTKAMKVLKEIMY